MKASWLSASGIGVAFRLRTSSTLIPGCKAGDCAAAGTGAEFPALSAIRHTSSTYFMVLLLARDLAKWCGCSLDLAKARGLRVRIMVWPLPAMLWLASHL